MKHFVFLFLFVPFVAAAQALVEERQVIKPAHTQTQQKADYARKEKAKAVDRVRQAEQNLKEAQRAQSATEKQFEAAKQTSASAQSALEKAQADLSQAEARATQTEAEAVQTWRGDRPAK